ncbi:hypothetical protein [Ruegeria arenilitoris]|uniref:hypothetical protein n=1 Tax=Ruegeria arenilitoris TaxID=1173585 RepID=UPI00147D6245|nr:hypothetical protein [Ruegeria arenilitoris]
MTRTDQKDEEQIFACGQIVSNTAHMMQDEVGASVETIIDRMLTYAVAQMVSFSGSVEAAAKQPKALTHGDFGNVT